MTCSLPISSRPPVWPAPAPSFPVPAMITFLPYPVISSKKVSKRLVPSWEPYVFPKLKFTATGRPSCLAVRRTKSTASINWVVLGKLSARGIPSFTTISSLSQATPRYSPLLPLPFPAAIAATAVPWPLVSAEGTICSAAALFRPPEPSRYADRASFISSFVYTISRPWSHRYRMRLVPSGFWKSGWR